MDMAAGSTPEGAFVPKITRVHLSRQARITGAKVMELVETYQVLNRQGEMVKIVGSERVSLHFDLVPDAARAKREEAASAIKMTKYIRMRHISAERAVTAFNSDFGTTGMFANLPPIPFALLGDEFPAPTPPIESQDSAGTDDCPDQSFDQALHLTASVWSIVDASPLPRIGSDLSLSDSSKSDKTVGKDVLEPGSTPPGGTLASWSSTLATIAIPSPDALQAIKSSISGVFSSLTSPASSSASSIKTNASNPEGMGNYYSGLGDDDEFAHIQPADVLAAAAEVEPFLAIWLEEHPEIENSILTIVEVDDLDLSSPSLGLFIRMKVDAGTVARLQQYPSSLYSLTKITNPTGRTRAGSGNAVSGISVALKPRSGSV